MEPKRLDEWANDSSRPSAAPSSAAALALPCSCVLGHCRALACRWAAASRWLLRIQPPARRSIRCCGWFHLTRRLFLSVEDLRDQLHAFTASRLFAGLKQLPAVKAWIESDKAQQLVHSRDQIEAALGTKLTDICDELMGDAVVLALRLPPDGPADPSQARGLLLFQARNTALLERMIQAVNGKQKASGELARRHRTGTRRNDLPHARIPPGRVASAGMVHHLSGRNVCILQLRILDPVGDRPQAARIVAIRCGCLAHSRAFGAGVDRGLTDLARFQSVRRRQPAKALARLFIDPRQIERLIADKPRPSKASDARIMAMLERYLAAVEYAGATLEWNDTGVVLQTVETLDRSKLEPWLLRWAGNEIRPDPTLSPRARHDHRAGLGPPRRPGALRGAIRQIVPDRRPAEAQESGDHARRPVARSGPAHSNPAATRAGLDRVCRVSARSSRGRPRRGGAACDALLSPFAQVLVASLRKSGRQPAESAPAAGGVTAAAAIENALRTVLSLAALDEKRNNGRSEITTRSVAGANVTTLDSPIPFAYALDAARLSTDRG